MARGEKSRPFFESLLASESKRRENEAPFYKDLGPTQNYKLRVILYFLRLRVSHEGHIGCKL